MERIAVMRALSFGAQVAEEETGELASYFVETDQWSRIFKGEVDIVPGEKGSGKSAIYALLVAKADDLFDDNILLITAEKPRGTPVFKQLATNPPTTEEEFIGLSKLYILTLIARKMKEFDVRGAPADKVYRALESLKLLEGDWDLSRFLQSAMSYARSRLRPKSVEGEIKFDSATGLPIGISG